MGTRRDLISLEKLGVAATKDFSEEAIVFAIKEIKRSWLPPACGGIKLKILQSTG